MNTSKRFSVFAGHRNLVTGPLEEVLPAARDALRSGTEETVLIFDNTTGRQIDVDLSAAPEVELARIRSAEHRKGRGRPKLGVECNELCLLPRHWEWLAAQPRSASASIRRLIDAARKNETPEARVREQIDTAAAFMWAMAGDFPGFEEASRALYRQEWELFRERIAEWPDDVRAHVEMLLESVLPGRSDDPG